ncbi:MAG: ABC transporter permease, partial [Legionellales bacterium]|nr:ABC transporter permease [Legionellales bacterium]
MISFHKKELIIPYIILFIMMFLSVYPLLYMISVSLMTSGEASNQYLLPKVPRFDNYIEVWTSNNFQQYTLNSIIISGLIVVGVLSTSIPAAYAFAKIEFPFRD